jgi:hypothetical protein
MSRTFVIVCLILGAALAAAPVPGPSDAIWARFDRMTPDERQNAELSLQPGPRALAGAWDESREICRLWNSGDFDAALVRLRGFARFDDPSEVLVAVSWRKPVETPRQTLNAAVRIGTRDSIWDLSMDRSADGTLWALTPCPDSGTSYLQVCKSTDNGSSWEDVSWMGVGGANSFTAWSAACNGTYYSVSFARRDNPNHVWSVRLRMNDGAWIRYSPGDSIMVTGFVAASGDTVKELAECSQEDTLPGLRVVLFGRTKNRLLYASWSDSTCGAWRPLSTDVTNCDNGLDCTFIEGSTVRKLWASWLTYVGSDSAYPAWGYFTTADTLFHTGGAIYSPARRFPFEPTSIAAWYDTVGIAYTAPSGRCRILYTPDAGNSWSVGYLSPYTADTAEYPEVSARDGGGFAAAYRVRTTAANCWVEAIHAGLVGGPYSIPDTISDPAHRPAPTSRIRILPLDSGSYGVGWINWDDAVYGGAWFAVYTPSGIAETPAPGPLPLSFRTLLTQGGAKLCFENLNPGQVRLRVFDGAGRLVWADCLTLAAGRQTIGFRAPASGVYIAVLDAAGKTASTRFAAVR